eukprot:TRINITY_DN44826_c0_g1_i1.p1 TRINITY_DN44826_c0_g1~~TRINITY_DN44826_c0_g1_i1.p1  ORF type:complete len:318 (+),score=37.04 TRINITY_DN44826_c0_g1_i1:81-1034(+)
MGMRTCVLVLVPCMIGQTTAVQRSPSPPFGTMGHAFTAGSAQLASQVQIGGDRNSTSRGWKLSETAVWWLHIPECGANFGFSTNACERASGRRESTHQVLPVVAPTELLYSVVSMFRRPGQRLAAAHSLMQSAYRNNFSCCVGDWGWQPRVYKQVREANARNASLSDALGNFKGCQTNMVVGHGCMSARPYNRTEVEEARRRVRMFLFVGLVERWSFSMCLFNYLLTGERFIMDFQLAADRRPNHTSHDGHDYDETGLSSDLADEEVYDEAVSRFRSDVRRHNITHENCHIRTVPPDMQLPAFQYHHDLGVEPSGEL